MERDKKYASRNALRITNLAVIILLIIVLLFWWRGNSNGDIKLKGVNPSQISIRQNNGQIQYQFLDGEWQNIISISDLKGDKGESGADGRDGANGKNGENGAPGKDGLNGQNGTDGKNGTNGKDGKDGINGVNGRDGAKGDKGDRGEQGLKGDTGAQGAKGDKGDRGEQGLKGDNGAQGAKGDKGDRGTNGREIELRKDSLYIQWRYEGDSSWNNLIAYSDLKGAKGDKGDRGEQGLKGDQGIQGIAGVGIPQTLSLNNGILSLSHGGGSIALPNNNLGAYSVFRMTSADTSNVFASGRLAREFDDNRNYMIINNATGQGFIHVDFWASSVSNHKQILSLPANAPTPKELSEVQLFDGGSVWIVPGAKNVQIQGLSPNRRYVDNIPVMVEPIK